MFKNYEIKYINNEEILYLYIDLNTNFGKIKSKRRITINEEIKNYIEKKKIKFNGQKIILMASSLLIGTFLYTTPLLYKEKVLPNYNYTTNIIATNTNLNIDTLNQNITNDLLNETNTIKENISNNHFNNIKNNAKEETFKETTTNAAQINQNNSNTETENIKDNNKNVKEENKTATTQMVSIKRSDGTILYMELEEYLIGVVAAEMPASFNIEALKAQAVAARTYAIKAIENNTILTDTVSTQAYKDSAELKQMWKNNYDTYYKKIKKAVDSTNGLVMYYNNTLINAFYHSTSNGYTEDSTQVFGSYPYLKSVESTVDKNVSSYLRTISYNYDDISNILDIPITSLSNIIIEKNSSNRVKKIIIDNNTYEGIKFRSILGLRSTDFEITLNEENVTITTRGYGHGVGMSQYGANEYAKQGMNYQNILKHYYTGITIKKY